VLGFTSGRNSLVFRYNYYVRESVQNASTSINYFSNKFPRLYPRPPLNREDMRLERKGNVGREAMAGKGEEKWKKGKGAGGRRKKVVREEKDRKENGEGLVPFSKFLKTPLSPL
jgi:hypothetical protein